MTKRHVIFWESFDEHNNFAQRVRLRRKGTAGFRLKDMTNYFNIICFNPPLVNKLHSQDSLFVGEKRNAKVIK